jgi:hypothetical protein
MGAFLRKVNLQIPFTWGYHRYGWRFAVEAIRQQLHCPEGTFLVSSVDDWFGRGQTLREPWVGFVHGIPRNPAWMEHRWDDVAHLVQRPQFQVALPYCRGLFTLSQYLKHFLDGCSLPVSVNAVLHPCYTPPSERHFNPARFLANPRKRILHLGQWMRVVQSFFDLPSGRYEKTLLKCGGGHDLGLAPSRLVVNDSVALMDRVDDDTFDQLLSDNVVFLDLFDASANNSVVECLVRNTPLVVNRLPAVVEYLGEDYPLYYATLDEAAEKLESWDLMVQASEYLSQSPVKSQLTQAAFAKAVAESTIYTGLPTVSGPRRQRFRSDVRACRVRETAN